MPSTPTTRLRLEKQGAGENNNTWGAPKLNTVLDLIDFAIGGRTAFNLSGSMTLTATNFGADQARCMFLDVAGGSGGTVTIPAVEKMYIVRNATTGDVIITTGGSTNAVVKSNNIRPVVSDGSNVYVEAPNDAGGARISNVGTPTSNGDAATKAYVDTGDATQKAYTDATAFAMASGQLPGQSGNAGKFLKTNGSAASWAYPVQPWIIKSANYTAAAGDRIAADTSGGAFTVTLPASANDGDELVIADDGYGATNVGWAANNLTVARNGNTIMGATADLLCQTRGAAFRLVFETASNTWKVRRL